MKKEKNNKTKNIMDLFSTFFKIGAFTFGGGYAMIPLIQKEVCENKKWVTEKDILDIIAIAESTPGPISVNTATFVGYKLAGIWGAMFATFGLILPSFIIIAIISLVLKEFESIKIVQYAFFGIRAGILALILKAFFTMYKACPQNTLSNLLIILAFSLVVFFDINAIIVIITCGIIGLLHTLIILRRSEK